MFFNDKRLNKAFYLQKVYICCHVAPAPGMTEKQAERELNKTAVMFEDQCRLGYAPDNKQTFAQYAEYVLSRKEEAGTKHRTLARYRELLERINAGIGHIKLADLRPQHLTELYSQLRQSGIRKNSSRATATADLSELIAAKELTKKRLSELSGVSLTTLSAACNYKAISGEKAEAICKALKISVNKAFKVEQDSRPLSEKTIQEHHRLISLILSYAEKEMLVLYNAAAKVINKPKADRAHEVNYFEPEELDRTRECLSKEPLKWQVITHLLIVTGCRRGEIMGLKWSAVDFASSQIKINNNLQSVSSSTETTAISSELITTTNITSSTTENLLVDNVFLMDEPYSFAEVNPLFRTRSVFCK